MTDNKLHKDLLGNEILIGDKVLFMQIKYRSFMEGIIKTMAAKSALITHDKTNTCKNESRQDYSQIISLSALDMVSEQLQSENERLKAERDKLTEYIIKLIKKHDDDVCYKCKNYIKCKGKECDYFMEGIGATGSDGEEHADFIWTCEDFNYGTCRKLTDTPCNGCFDNDYKGFDWVGLEEQNG